MRSRTLDDFYRDTFKDHEGELSKLLPSGITKDIGHFNVFDIATTIREVMKKSGMPYDRRSYYKISLIRGRSRAEYADKVVEIKERALLFATPKVPYRWVPEDDMSGSFCVFTDEFLLKNKSGIVLDELPIFKSGGYPVFEITKQEEEEMTYIFNKMQKEISSDYEFKYDLLRNYVMELIHYGQKLQPASLLHAQSTASSRITSLFIELLERQFPIETTSQRLALRTANEYAERLAVHVNHLNRVLKDSTGKTTTELIKGRILQEAKVLLKQTDWSVSEISYSLGFEEVAHFSNFFKKFAFLTPLAFRS